MLYCLMIITREEPTRSHIARIMQPYDSENPDRFSPDTVLPPLSFSYDSYRIGGNYHDCLQLRDGSRSSSAKVSDITNFNEVDCYFCIDENSGGAIERESTFGNDNGGVDRAFLEELIKIKANSQDCYATIIEVHS